MLNILLLLLFLFFWWVLGGGGSLEFVNVFIAVLRLTV